MALMLAIYMVARLIRSLLGPRPATPTIGFDGSKSIHLPDAVDAIAILAIAYLAYDVYTLGAKASADMANLKGIFPTQSP